MNVPFRSIGDLLPERFEETAQPLKLFTCAVYANEEFWGCTEKVVAYLRKESHRDYYVDTFISYLQSVFDTHRLWRLKVIR